MPVENTYEIKFEREHVPQPIMCEMSRACRDVMFNIDYLSVSKHDALMKIGLVGDPEAVARAEQCLKKSGASMSLLSSGPFRGQIPSIPARTAMVAPKGPPIDKKIWLTIVGSLRRQPLFWVLSRRFDITFRILQSTVGDPVSILCLVLTGAPQEVEGAVHFLRDQGVDVEYGELRPGD